MVREMRLRVGARFGRGVVQEILPYKKCSHRVRMLCDCGNEYLTYSTSLYSNMTKSCGCLHQESITIHGHSSKLLWARWKAMLARCYNPRNRSYKDYGARGIKVCSRWKDSFEAFCKDMGEPSPGMQLDRVDNDGDYTPENCKWSTKLEQMRNTRFNHRYSFQGKNLTLGQIAEVAGMNKNTLKNRILRYGMTLEEAVSTPLKPRGRHKRTEELK